MNEKLLEIRDILENSKSEEKLLQALSPVERAVAEKAMEEATG